MKKQNTTLYNIVFPVWLLFAMPQFWIVALPANWIIDFLVIFVTARRLTMDSPGKFALKSVWLTWLAGFFADAAGGIIMLYDDFAGPSTKTPFGEWFNSTVGRAIYNPFDNVFAFLWTLLSVLVSAVLIYLLNRSIYLHDANLEPIKAKKIALSLAVFTAPYLFFVPTLF